ncbi:hypothetical protein V1478_013948 [Vespula squamosa]|uniref:Ribosomal protein S3 n=1 Tax=Vespula squamosa TaxID=30214 RepID=A0ABD2A7F3_VESSQ
MKRKKKTRLLSSKPNQNAGQLCKCYRTKPIRQINVKSTNTCVRGDFGYIQTQQSHSIIVEVERNETRQTRYVNKVFAETRANVRKYGIAESSLGLIGRLLSVTFIKVSKQRPTLTTPQTATRTWRCGYAATLDPSMGELAQTQKLTAEDKQKETVSCNVASGRVTRIVEGERHGVEAKNVRKKISFSSKVTWSKLIAQASGSGARSCLKTVGEYEKFRSKSKITVDVYLRSGSIFANYRRKLSKSFERPLEVAHGCKATVLCRYISFETALTARRLSGEIQCEFQTSRIYLT